MNLGKSICSQRLFPESAGNRQYGLLCHYQLARLYSQVGDYENAVLQFNVLRDQDTTKINPVIYRNIADCL